MTETRRAVPKGAALFISLFLPVSRLSSCSAARPIRSPLLHAPHLLPLPPPETAKDLPACPRLPILHLPAGSSARQTTATGTPLSPPPLPCAHRRSSSQRDRHGEELTRLVKEIRARRSSICRLLHERHDQAGIRRSNVSSAFRSLKKLDETDEGCLMQPATARIG